MELLGHDRHTERQTMNQRTAPLAVGETVVYEGTEYRVNNPGEPGLLNAELESCTVRGKVIFVDPIDFENPETDDRCDDALLAEIARDVLKIETLDERKSDRLDFYEVSVWSVKEALRRAYHAGRCDA